MVKENLAEIVAQGAAGALAAAVDLAFVMASRAGEVAGIPAHVRHTGWGSAWFRRPGRTPSCPQFGQMPWVRIAV
jgi:hypothetical protein